MFICKQAREFKRSVLNPLWVLMWKHMTERRHRYCYTIWEIFGGVLVFLVLFMVNQTVTPKATQLRARNSNSNDTVTRVYYTPHNDFTRRLMAKVGYHLENNTEADFLPTFKWNFMHQATKVPDFDVSNTSNSIALLNFKNRGFDDDLVYSINVFADEEKSVIYRAYNGLFQGIIEPEEPTPPFLGSLQWAIDKSYMEQLSEHDMGQSVMMRTKPEYISRELRALQKFMIICTIIAPLPFFLINSSRLIHERRTGLRELMKLAGVSRDVLRFSQFMDIACVATMYAIPTTLVLKMTSNPILPYSNEYLIAFTIVLHFISATSLSFVTNTLSQDYNYADSLGIFIYISSLIVDFMWYSHKARNQIVIFIVCCILPHAPIYLFWDEVLYLEELGQGIQFWNIGHTYGNSYVPVIRVWGFFFAQMGIITTLAWYLDLVRPGRHGISLKWNFLFKKNYWYYGYENPPAKREKPPKVIRDEKYFENGPKKAEIAVKIINVTKVFKGVKKSTVKALDGVSFNCYKGEVTALLGVNGAGKSTLMSIVTGMYSTTNGAVYIHGKNVAYNLQELRENIALCTQQNLTFSYLTVKENIKFFHWLRKKPADSESLTVEQLLKKLKLKEKANLFTGKLPYGKLRSLQVACTLAGGADMLVLDEPTSGMDVDVKHDLWDLIMALRGNKTILMSTTCLEEATALGDRIVILNSGKIQCHGTPMFLKQALGVSFNLSVSIKDSTHMLFLTDIVEGIIPNVRHRVHDIKRITFALPSKEHHMFPMLFETLEQKRHDLGITMIDVGMFMEEVFLEFVEDEDEDPFEISLSVSCRHVTMEPLLGYTLCFEQMKMLIRRVIKYRLQEKYQFIIWQIIIPIIGFVIITLTTNQCLGHGRMFSHKESSRREVTALIYNTGPFRRSGLYDTLKKYPAVQAVYSKNMDKDFADPVTGHSTKSTIGLKMTEHHTTIYHPLEPYIISKSINMYSNIYMSVHMPYQNHNITTTYGPIPRYSKKVVEPKSVFLCLKWTVWIVFLSVLPLAPLITLCIVEYRDGTRDTHIMAGCSPLMHWSSKFVVHLAGYLAVVPLPLIIITVSMDLDKTFNQLEFIGSLLAMQLAFGPAFITHLYLMSFIFLVKYAICKVYIMSVCFGIILPTVIAVLEPIWKTNILLKIPYICLMVFARFDPLFAFAVGLGRLTLQARLNAICRVNRRFCPDLVTNDVTFPTKVCCGSKLRSPFKYFVSHESGLYDFATLILQFAFFSALLISLENRIPQNIMEQIIMCYYKPPPSLFHDINVKNEEDYVQTMIRRGNFKSDMLLAYKLHKAYISTSTSRRHAVHGVSFSGKLGECIAIIGQPDSGKTSLLRMLAGTQVMTRGNSVVNGQCIRMSRSQYLRSIYYASATGGMDSFLTGFENLVFLAKLRGHPELMAKNISLMSLKFLGLHANLSRVSQYSSGCARRLALCGALVLMPPVALLDEPLLAVDATSRPLVTRALTRLVLEPAVVVVTEGSVDWGQMESVYSRIAIMAKGHLMAIGAADEVFTNVANGYTARIKLVVVTAYREDKESVYNEEEESSSSDSEAGMHSEKSVMYAKDIVSFKREFKRNFENSIVIGEHLCMLYFHIPDPLNKLRYSEMFRKLEDMKEKYTNVVEDYILSSTTVEDVFWRLAHEKHSKI